MTDPVFVDSNVLVYSRDPSETTKHEAAVQWVDHLWANANGRLSAQVLSEFYIIVTRKLSPGMTTAEAANEASALYVWDPVAVNAALLDSAFAMEDRYQLSWWDSLIVAAAQRAGCRYLLSEDFQAGQDFDGVTVVDPFATTPAEVA